MGAGANPASHQDGGEIIMGRIRQEITGGNLKNRGRRRRHPKSFD